MSDFTAKIRKNRFPLGLCPRPHWRSYSAPPDRLPVFKGPTSKGKEEEEEGGEEGGEGKGRK